VINAGVQFGRQCTTSGSQAVGLQENSSKKTTVQNNIYLLYTASIVLGFGSKQRSILVLCKT